MDADDTGFTPRGTKKKKSALSRLAAQRGKNNTPRASIASGGSENIPKYPIDANVEIQNRTEEDAEDSDEGIGMANSAYDPDPAQGSKEIDSDPFKLESSTGTTIKQMRHLNMSSPLLEEEETGETNHTPEDTKGEKRNRDTNSSGEELAADTGRKSSRKHPHSRHDEGRNPSHKSKFFVSEDDGASPSEASTVADGSSSDHVTSPGYSTHTYTKDPLGSRSRDQGIIDPLEASSKKHSRLTDDVHHDSLTDKYRDALEETEGDDYAHHERTELYDHLGDLKPRRSGSPPAYNRAYSGGSVQASMLSSWDREWPAVQKLKSESSGTDASSERSFQFGGILPPVATQDVKDRSFLVGSMTSRSSLLGADELDRLFPERKIKIFVCTWNMCEMKELPESLDDFLLPDVSESVSDAYVVGSQESMSNRKEWEIRLQETLGPHHVLFHSAALGVLYLNIFLRRDLIWYCSAAEEANVSTRAGPTGLKTKGAVAVSFTIFGSSLLFINSHLTPHDGKAKERAADFHKINGGLTLPKSANSKAANTKGSPSKKSAAEDGGVTSRFDCVFWAGDLNFRLEKERERLDKTIEGIKSQDTPNFGDLIVHDELFRIRNEELAFQAFQEGKIKFKPTYKYDIGTDTFDTSKKMRIPSYTDRVLFRCKKKNAISCLHYGSAESMRHSDHRPVFAVFEVELRPGRDNICLSGGHFDRDVWLEGNRRRAEKFDNKKKSEKQSTVCSIQ